MTTLAEVEAAATALKREDRERLEAVLRALRQKEEAAYLQELYRPTGFTPLPIRTDGKPVTSELVRQICEEEEFERYRLSQAQSVLEIAPISVGKILLPLSSDDDLLGEMLEGRL